MAKEELSGLLWLIVRLQLSLLLASESDLSKYVFVALIVLSASLCCVWPNTPLPLLQGEVGRQKPGRDIS
jgi:hypothetical protein